MKSLFFLLFLITPLISQGIDATKLGGLYFSGSFQKPGPNGSNIPLPFNKQSRLHLAPKKVNLHPRRVGASHFHSVYEITEQMVLFL
jgi:hypothetical protein